MFLIQLLEDRRASLSTNHILEKLLKTLRDFFGKLYRGIFKGKPGQLVSSVGNIINVVGDGVSDSTDMFTGVAQRRAGERSRIRNLMEKSEGQPAIAI